MKELQTSYGRCVADAICTLRCQRGLSRLEVAARPNMRGILGEYSEICIREIESHEFDAPVGFIRAFEDALDFQRGTVCAFADRIINNPDEGELFSECTNVLRELDSLAEIDGINAHAVTDHC